MLSMDFGLQTMAFGALVSVFSLYFAGNHLVGAPFSEKYPINILVHIKFFIFLVFKIYIAAFSAIKTIFTGNANPKLLTLKTELKSDFSRTILANAITLTPGTLSMDKRGDVLRVLWLDPKTDDQDEAKEMIFGNFERILKSGENI